MNFGALARSKVALTTESGDSESEIDAIHKDDLAVLVGTPRTLPIHFVSLEQLPQLTLPDVAAVSYAC